MKLSCKVGYAPSLLTAPVIAAFLGVLALPLLAANRYHLAGDHSKAGPHQFALRVTQDWANYFRHLQSVNFSWKSTTGADFKHLSPSEVEYDFASDGSRLRTKSTYVATGGVSEYLFDGRNFYYWNPAGQTLWTSKTNTISLDAEFRAAHMPLQSTFPLALMDKGKGTKMTRLQDELANPAAWKNFAASVTAVKPEIRNGLSGYVLTAMPKSESPFDHVTWKIFVDGATHYPLHVEASNPTGSVQASARILKFVRIKAASNEGSSFLIPLTVESSQHLRNPADPKQVNNLAQRMIVDQKSIQINTELPAGLFTLPDQKFAETRMLER